MSQSGHDLFGASPPGGEGLRQAVAAFVLAHEDSIRATARRKLASAARPVCDSEDILLSVLRRMDNLARRGRLRIGTEQELIGLICTIAANTSLSKARLIARTRTLAIDDPECAECLIRHVNLCEDDDDAALLIYRMAIALGDSTDRQVLFALLRGASLRAVAGMLGATHDAARQRWSRICRRLRDSFAREGAE